LETKSVGKILLYGIVGSFFFAFTFVLNRSMNISGGYWMYSAVLRYIFTLPILFFMLFKGRMDKAVIEDIKKQPVQWLIWSTVGFGLFYLPLTAASVFAESWFICAMWQITIVCGILLTPLFGKKIPIKNLLCSFLILIGIALMQAQHFGSANSTGLLLAFILILIGAFSYPLGNRKTMSFCSNELSTIQRVYGMTLCSMPFWIISGIVAFTVSGPPESGQCIQSLGVALFSGVIATILFFKATDMAKGNAMLLAIAEATQCGEVIFTLILGIVFLNDAIPSPLSFVGISLIVIGMVLTSLLNN